MNYRVFYSPWHDRLFIANDTHLIDILNWNAKLPDPWFNKVKLPCVVFVKRKRIPKTFVYIGEI